MLNTSFSILIFTTFLTISFNSHSYESVEAGKASFYRKIFSSITYIKKLKITDNISKNPINNKILKVYDSQKKHIGYIRNIETTTGCDSACLPVVFTLFYDQSNDLIKLLSKPGLTKKYHAKFTEKDYEKLSLILMLNPKVFNKVQEPTEMVDIISGATKSEFQNDVVKNAAYTSLRVNLYNQDTLKILKTLNSSAEK